MSIRFKKHIATVIYQYMSSLCYINIHLISFIRCYCTLIYNKYFILLYFICKSSQTFAYVANNHHKLCLSENFRINSFMVFSKAILCCRQLNLPPLKSFDGPDVAKNETRPHRAMIKTCSSIGGRSIAVR